MRGTFGTSSFWHIVFGWFLRSIFLFFSGKLSCSELLDAFVVLNAPRASVSNHTFGGFDLFFVAEK
jgi:hypothetical protein